MADKSQSFRDVVVWQKAHALAHDLSYANTLALQADLEEVSRLLQGYINGLERDGT